MRFSRYLKNRKKKHEIYADEILIDSINPSDLNIARMQGKIENPINQKVLRYIFSFFILLLLTIAVRSYFLQIVKGEEYLALSNENKLRNVLVFAERGIIYDRNNEILAFNEKVGEQSFSKRVYSHMKGTSHLIGFVSYPKKDSSGFFYELETEGLDGIEKKFNKQLSGEAGNKLVELTAKGEIKKENVIYEPRNGLSVEISIDSRVQNQVFTEIEILAKDVGFNAGAGVIMNVENGEILAMTSFPEFNQNDLVSGNDHALQKYLEDPRSPFLNRAVNGLYAPGSIIKPFLAISALNEKIISPEKEILSTGAIRIENPYDPSKPSIYRDWKAHGYIDMRRALAFSSDEYFYQIGGGYENQQGLGIEKINAYMKIFGFGEPTGFNLYDSEPFGVVPSPEWKKESFNGEDWLLGNTYHTSIGQYGFQITPMQAVKAIASLATGKIVSPTILKNNNANYYLLPFSEKDLKVVREGMEMAVQEGTAQALKINGVKVAGKTGTAEIGNTKKFVNSWVIGFFPADKPKYAFALVMEKGPYTNLIGAPLVMRRVLEWMLENTPEYFDK